jgi:diguanylate cyclase (GGDEF)-like protein
MLSADIRNALNKIKDVSDTDELTGLYNMRAFGAILQRGFREAARHSQPLSLAMIDSDNLKAINDSYGHDAGNKLLVQLVNRIRDAVRTSDTIARYGAMSSWCYYRRPARRSGEVAERVRGGIGRASTWRARCRTTVSVGLTIRPTEAT